MKPEIEVIIEPDVVPRGTVDLRGFVAPHGARPPRVRVTQTGLVVPLASGKSEPAEPLTPSIMAEVRTAAREAILTGSALPALPPASADAISAAVGDETSETETLSVESNAPTVAPPELVAAAAHTDQTDIAALDRAAQEPMPPRPAAADSPELVVSGMAYDRDVGFDTGLGLGRGGVGGLLEVTKPIVWLLVLTVGILTLYLFLMGVWPPWEANTAGVPDSHPDDQTNNKTEVEVDYKPGKTKTKTKTKTAEEKTKTVEEKTKADPITPPVVKTTDEDPVDLDSEIERFYKKTEDPIDERPDEPEASPEEKRLARARELASMAETGTEVGIEEEVPGTLDRMRQLGERAAALIEKGDYAAASEALAELLRHDPEDALALFRMGIVLHETGKLDEAIAHYQRAAEHAPQDSRPWNNLHVVYLTRGEKELARESLDEAFRRGPENPDVVVNMANQLAVKRPAQAHPLYDKALAIDFEHQPARIGRASVRERLGDLDGAQADYRILTESKGPYVAEGWDGQGRVLRRLGRHDKAVAAHKRALVVKDTPAFRINLGIALIDARRAGEAAKVLERAVRQDPGSAKAWLTLGVAYARLGSRRSDMLFKAKKAYEKAIKLDRTNWSATYNYALLAERVGNFPVAIRFYEASIKLQPRAWQAYANLARLYQDTGRLDRALSLIDKALKKSPSEPELHLHRAYLLANLGRRIDARSALRRFIELAPRGDPRLDRIRRSLDGERDGG